MVEEEKDKGEWSGVEVRIRLEISFEKKIFVLRNCEWIWVILFREVICGILDMLKIFLESSREVMNWEVCVGYIYCFFF